MPLGHRAPVVPESLVGSFAAAAAAAAPESDAAAADAAAVAARRAAAAANAVVQLLCPLLMSLMLLLLLLLLLVMLRCRVMVVGSRGRRCAVVAVVGRVVVATAGATWIRRRMACAGVASPCDLQFDA
jgi:hypothetical protein